MHDRLALWTGGNLSSVDATAWLGGPPASEKLTDTSVGSNAWYRLSATINGHAGDYLLDTGSPSCLLTSQQARRVGLQSVGQANLSFLDANGAGGMGVATSLSLPWRSVASPLVCIVNAGGKVPSYISKNRSAGLIGLDSFTLQRQ